MRKSELKDIINWMVGWNLLLVLLLFAAPGCQPKSPTRFYSYDGSITYSDPAIEAQLPQLRKNLDRYVLSGQLLSELLANDELSSLHDILRKSHYYKLDKTGYAIHPPLKVDYMDKEKGEALMKLQAYALQRAAEILLPESVAN